MTNSTRYRSRSRVLAVALACTVVIAACGSDDDSGSSDTTAGSGSETSAAATTAGAETTAAATTAAATPGEGPADESLAPIVIGVAAPLTGPFSTVSGTAAPVAEAWAKWVNEEKGGVDGHPVEIVSKDTKSDAAAAASVLAELVEQEGATAVIVADAAIEAAMSTYLVSKNVPVIGAIGNDANVWTKLPNYFGLFATTTIGSKAGMLAAETAGATKFGAMVCAEVPVCAQLDQAFTAGAPAYNLEYAGYVTAAAAAAPSFTAECLTMLDKGVDDIILSLGAATILRVTQDCTQQGYTGSYGILSTSVSGTNFDATPGLKANGAINQFPWWSTAEPVEQYRTVLEKEAPDAETTTPAATGTWASLELFRKAMAGGVSAEPTSADVFTAYAKVKDETLDGLLPAPVTFTAGQPSTPITCTWLYSYTDGEFTTETSGPSGNGEEGDLATSCIA